MLPCWNDTIAADILGGKKVVLSIHGNSMRALIMHIEGLSAEEILNVELKTATPVVYTLDHNLKAISKVIIDGKDSTEF